MAAAVDALAEPAGGDGLGGSSPSLSGRPPEGSASFQARAADPSCLSKVSSPLAPVRGSVVAKAAKTHTSLTGWSKAYAVAAKVNAPGDGWVGSDVSVSCWFWKTRG